MAFLTPTALSVPSAASGFRPSTCRVRQRTATANTSNVRMVVKDKRKVETNTPFSNLEEDRRAVLESEYRGPQGFTPYSEKVNGRIATMGFFIGLVTELVSGKTINEQIFIMFSPLTNLVSNVFGLGH